MPNTVVMMSNTQEVVSLTGEPCKADGWFGHSEGLHTVVFQVVNFTGRIHIEASLSLNPTEDDWFPIQLTPTTTYIQYPVNPQKPTGNQETGGDTSAVGVTFRVNALWIRARMDRSYLSPALLTADDNALQLLGMINKITLAR